MKNKILALFCRKEGRIIVDLLGKETFQGTLIMKKSGGAVTMNTANCSWT